MKQVKYIFVFIFKTESTNATIHWLLTSIKDYQTKKTDYKVKALHAFDMKTNATTSQCNFNDIV